MRIVHYIAALAALVSGVAIVWWAGGALLDPDFTVRGARRTAEGRDGAVVILSLLIGLFLVGYGIIHYLLNKE
jgi:hypothetical protein